MSEMVENAGGDPKQEIRRTHVMALMRFFSVDSDMSLPNTAATQMPEMVTLAHLRNRQFVLKVVQLITGFICVGIYTEGLKFLRDSINSMMYPNIVFSSFIIITSVILLSCLLGCAMPDVLTRIFNILGMILYFSASTVILYEALTKKINEELNEELVFQRKLLFVTSVFSYFNSVLYAVDVYFSIKRAITFEPK
ncbi:uncharacterized protein LOC108918001 [Anoplophora glabripennis]|uniref:uncharacterized protein LOC108918001 n=1 Tax=Anoplophora glabripennis TaxID=217634 RepID=UPI000873D2E5|nr:uncharacterized protein LOC108918001 [Anoplophora glabripennis]